MTKRLVVGVCAAVGAIVGVALAEWIAPGYPLGLVIVGLGGGSGAAVGSLLAAR